jgi:site-specific recombinase XerD
MSTAIVTAETTSHALTVPTDLEAVKGYVAESLAPNTRRAYRSALTAFRAWCAAEGVDPMPASPETVAAFIAAEADAGRKVSTLEQRIAAIRWAHDAAGFDSPTAAKALRATMGGIRRSKGVAPTRKAAATVDRLAAMVSHADPETVKGCRDRALLLFGFASAMRRSELVALDLADLELTERGLFVTLRRSKGDQEGQGQQRAVPFGRNPETCPVRALAAWFEAAGITEGRVFRSVDRHGHIGGSLSGRAVADVVKGYAKRAGLDPAAFGGHSLRAGFVTSSSERGAKADRIMDHTGHHSVAMIHTYTRRADAFADHAGEGLL